MARTLRFLVNSRGKRVTKRTATKTTRKRRTTRKPPAGYSSWSDYMAAIRPNARKRRASSGGSSMAKRKRRRSGTRRRRNPSTLATRTNPRGRRRRTRRNPPAFARSLLPFAQTAAVDAGMAIGGKIVARKVRGMIGQLPGTVAGSLVEVAIGVVGGYMLSKKNPRLGARFAQGAIMAPLETTVQQMKLPFISETLADDGFMMGAGRGVGLVSAYPTLAGYVTGPEAGYVTVVNADETTGYNADGLNGYAPH